MEVGGRLASGPSFRDVFGVKLLVMIILTHHVLAGLVGGLVYHAMEFSFQELKVAGPQMQVLSTVAFLPYSMKALIGLFSDGFPLFGLRKSPYIVITTILSLGAHAFLVAKETPSITASTASFFVIFFQIALADLMIQAKVSEKMKAAPEVAPDVATMMSAGSSVVRIFSNFLSAWLLQHFQPRVSYMVSLPVAAVLLWPAVWNYLGETKIARGSCSCSFKQNFIPFCLAVVSGMSAIGTMAFALLISSPKKSFLMALCLGVFNLTLLSFFLQPAIARINAFFFLQSMFHVGTHGAAFYFFTDTEAQYQNGPHLSRQFYVAGIGTMASICSLFGALCYKLFKNMRYRSILTSTNLAYALVNCLTVISYKRLNLQYGIPDQAFLLASSAMQTVIGQLAFMPLSLMLAQIVPQGIESVMLALLSASMNFGYSIANYAGAFILQELGVTPDGSDHEDHKFDHLWIAGLLSACGPCLPLLLLRLIPDGRQTDRLLEAGSATSGSLFERWSWKRPQKVSDDAEEVGINLSNYLTLEEEDEHPSNLDFELREKPR